MSVVRGFAGLTKDVTEDRTPVTGNLAAAIADSWHAPPDARYRLNRVVLSVTEICRLDPGESKYATSLGQCMRQTRRAYLATTASALALGTAGCLGGSGGNGASALDCDVPQREQVESLPAPAIGPEDATVVVDGWEDFACPHCATFSLEVLPKIESNYVSEGIVRYRHHDFPLPVNEWWSWKGASAARQVQNEADDEAFFDFTHTLYENQSEFSGGDAETKLSTLKGLADDAGLDGCSVATAASRDRYRPLLEAERTDAADDRGFRGTPTVLVNGQQVSPSWDAVESAIENAR